MSIPKYVSFFRKNIFSQFFKYSVVGIFNTIIGLGIILLLYNFYNVNYILSNIIGYFFGLINSFIWNKKWTFRSENPYLKEVLPFFTIFIISYIANLFTVMVSVEILRFNPNISQVLGTGIYAVSNFLLNRKWTFS